MGSFHTQILVRENDEKRCAEVMRSLGRRSYVIPPQNGISVVCDEESETQQIDVLDSVAVDPTKITTDRSGASNGG